ncbi:MAG: hypothetical protein ACLFUL_06370 [Desulfobacteraceae bacterium]
MNKIPGGYYIKARQIKDSDIAHAPPHVREIWDYLLREANHQGKKKHGFTLERGQLLTTYEDIQEALHWKVGWRKQKYTKWQCENTMKFLRKPRRNGSMITTKKTTRGLIITILNYDYYQNPKNYESHKENHNESHNESHSLPQTPDTIDKNEKNGRSNNTPPNPPQEGDPPNNSYPKSFLEFWEAYPRKVGKKAAFRAWKKAKDKPAIEQILSAIQEQQKSQKWQEGYIPNPATWINQGRWEDVIESNGEGEDEENAWRRFRERHPEAY